MAEKMRAIYLFMCGIAMVGCTGGGGSDLPAGQESAVVRLHADLMLLDQRALLTHKDSSFVAHGRDSVFASSGISRAMYEGAIDNYKRDPEEWKAFNLKIIARLEQLQKARALPKDTAKSPAKL
jgi:hypothetical protein